MAVGDIFESTWKWTADGDPLVNVVHYVNNTWDGSTSNSDLCIILGELVRDGTITFWEPGGPDKVAMVGVDCFVVNDPTSSGSISFVIAGDMMGDLIPLRSAPVAKKLTPFRGRSFRGRMFLPPVREADQASGAIDAGPLADLNTWLQDLLNLDDQVGNTFKMAVYSPTLSDPAMDIFEVKKLSSIVVQSIMGSIRKRQEVM